MVVMTMIPATLGFGAIVLSVCACAADSPARIAPSGGVHTDSDVQRERGNSPKSGHAGGASLGAAGSVAVGEGAHAPNIGAAGASPGSSAGGSSAIGPNQDGTRAVGGVGGALNRSGDGEHDTAGSGGSGTAGRRGVEPADKIERRYAAAEWTQSAKAPESFATLAAYAPLEHRTHD